MIALFKTFVSVWKQARERKRELERWSKLLKESAEACRAFDSGPLVMKKLFALIPLIVLAFGLTACQTSPKAIAYKTLKSTADAVDSAMKAYADLVVQGQVDLTTQTKVQGIHDKYRVAMTAAVQAAQFDTSAITPASVSQLAGDLSAAVAQIVAQPKSQMPGAQGSTFLGSPRVTADLIYSQDSEPVWPGAIPRGHIVNVYAIGRFSN